MYSRYALVISHGDCNKLFIMYNLSPLSKPSCSADFFKLPSTQKNVYACTDMHFTEQFLLIICNLHYDNFSVSVTFKNRN